MFEEFFSRAVAAGLITAEQKNGLMEFAKVQPVTSFVASRPPANPAPSPVVQPAVVLAPTPKQGKTCCGTTGPDWSAALVLALLCRVLGAWVGAADAGPLGEAIRLPLDLLENLLDRGFSATPGSEI